MLRAVLFDLDGTLADTERESAEALRRVLARRGFVMSEEELAYVIGHSWLQIYELLQAHHGAVLPSLEQLISESAPEREIVLRDRGMTVMPGACEVPRRFAARWPLAIVSGSSREEARFVLEALGLRETFRVVLAAEDYAPGKPNPAGYLLAAHKLGASPDECLVIEDSAAGIAAGRAAGMTVIAVRAGNFAGQDQSAADAVVPTLNDITDELLGRLYPHLRAAGPALE